MELQHSDFLIQPSTSTAQACMDTIPSEMSRLLPAQDYILQSGRFTEPQADIIQPITDIAGPLLQLLGPYLPLLSLYLPMLSNPPDVLFISMP